MLREYAVEPEVFSDVDFRTFMQVLDGFSFSNGRLISTFPKKWAREVYSILNKLNIQDNKKKSISNRLEKIALAKRSCNSWNHLLSWSENAQISHQKEPFHAIISETGKITIEDLHNENEYWKDCRQVEIPKTLEGFESVCKTVLKFAKKIKFIDPYFAPHEPRCIKPLVKFVELSKDGSLVSNFEFHLKVNPITAEYFEEKLKSLSDLLCLDCGQKFHFYRWNLLEGKDKDNFHPRFILTDKGGMHFDYGLDTGTGKNLVSLLENEIYNEHWNQFSEDSSSYDIEDSWCLENGQVKRVK
jgi:hypothetical protein